MALYSQRHMILVLYSVQPQTTKRMNISKHGHTMVMMMMMMMMSTHTYTYTHVLSVDPEFVQMITGCRISNIQNTQSTMMI